MAISKVIYNGTTLIDVTTDTVTSASLLAGQTAIKNDGVHISGAIVSKSSSDMTVSGKTVTAPAGFYASDASASVAEGTVTSGTADIVEATFTYNSTHDNFAISGSGAIGAPAIGVAGYISYDEGTRNGNTATLNAEAAKIVGVTTITGDTTKKPAIEKQTISISGVTDAANGSATTTEPSSGVYVAVKSNANTGTLTATPSVTTAGYGTSSNHGIVGNTATVGASASDITYVPITTTNITEGATTVASDIATRGEATWSNGYIAAGTMSAATFANTAASGKTTNSYVDLSSTSEAPVLVSGDYLYINKGYTDDVKISLAKLVPDGSDVKGHSDYILSGHSAYDDDGTLVAGTIPSIGAATYNTSSSDQTIASGNYLSGTQTIKAVTTSNIEAANIKYGTTVTVGDANNATRIKNVAGTFTQANTVSSGQTAAADGQILSGYSAWVDGAEVQGTIATKTSTDITDNGNGSVTAPAGYYATAQTKFVATGTITNNTTIPSGSSSTGVVNFGNAIKISSGYYSADAYYTAQAPSGVLSIDQTYNALTNIDCTNKQYVNISGINIPVPSTGKNTFALTLPNGASDTITLIFEVDTNGNTQIIGNSNNE